ncbi:uncharacterized protein LOC134220633 [Armigeres subalbatus]|uniref:uncharacterized protein LOC134220633 n=1 Tax=Armigeres subalbatus TaxID=124917 RepID=UPI002ED05282
MAFSVVQTRKTKKSKPCLSVVPSNWVNNENVFWPPRNLISLSTDENSLPDKCTWAKQSCKTVGRAKSYREAENIVSRLEIITDSEDAINMTHGTRANPAKKKPKFVSKSYELVPPQTTMAQVAYPQTDQTERNIQTVLQVNTVPDLKTISSKCPVSYLKKENESQPEELNTSLKQCAPNLTNGSPAYSPLDTSRIRSSPVNATSTVHYPREGSCSMALEKPINFPKQHEFAILQDAENTQSSHESQLVSCSNGTVSDTLNPEPSVNHPLFRGQDSKAVNMSQPVCIIRGDDGRQYVDLGNSCYMEIMGEESDPTVEVASNSGDVREAVLQSVPGNEIIENTGEANNEKITNELQKIHTKLDGLAARLDRVLSFSANFDKFMSAKQSASVCLERRREFEDFSELKALCPILSEDRLQVLENHLKNKVYADKFFRFFDSEYNLNGKRDGKAFSKRLFEE